MRAAVAVPLALASAGIATVGGYMLWWYLRNNTTDGALREMTNPTLTIATARALGFPEYWVRWDPKEVRFATRDGLPDPFQWPRVVAENGGRPLRHRIEPVPSNAVRVPFALYQRSDTRGIVAGIGESAAINPARGADRVRYLNAIRAVAARSRLAFADPRLLLVLLSKESNWDRAVHGNNPWNIKAQGSVYSPSYADLARTRSVYVTVPECSRLYILQDNLSSVDAYPAFDSMVDSFNYAHAVFGMDKYTNAIPALAIGGRDGCLQFAESIGGVYSGTAKASYRQWMLATWDACARLCGQDWVR